MISDRFIRWSAIVSSIFAMMIFAAWVLAGAQPVEALPPDLSTPITRFLQRLGTKASVLAVRVILMLAAITGAAAAILSLILLFRGAAIEAARLMGVAMGWAAACIAYFFFVSAAPPLAVLQPESLVIRILLDGGFFALLAFANSAFIRFWMLHPRPVTAEETAAFHTLNDERMFAATNPFLKKLLGRLVIGGWSEGAKERHRRLDRQVTEFMFGRKLLFASLLAGLIVLPIWRELAIFGDVTSTLRNLVVFIAINPTIVLVSLSVPFIGVNIKFHRVLGSVQEKRKVEWVWAAMMITFVLVLLMVAVAAFVSLTMLIAPAWVEKLHLLAVLGWCVLVAIGTAPLFFIIALALSILFRGTLDPRLVLGRFTLWSVLGVTLTFVFVLIERAVALKVVEWFELPPQTGSIAAGAMVAATFQPIRKTTEKLTTTWVGRMMPASMLAAGTRHEAAVVVTDITGYTALSAQDESSALVASALVQKEARQVVERFEGHFVKSTGDGAILYFHTADEAMLAVTGLHAAVRQGATALNIPLQLHTGVHWGEFVQARDGDIYGQTVNVASRIADFAQAGEIAVSRILATHLGHPAFALATAGPQRFKNVPDTIECLKLQPA